MCAEAVPQTFGGTVNIAFANANGLVLLTDSRQTIDHGTARSYKTAPKLFALDDKTVCSIANFSGEKFSDAPHFDNEVAGIIANFRDELSKKPVLELEAKLWGIGFLVGLYVDIVLNQREVVAPSKIKIKNYDFELIVAGYDADGTPKLAKLTMNPFFIPPVNGHGFWSHKSSVNVIEVSGKIVHMLGGEKLVSETVLSQPERFEANIVDRYVAAVTRDGGESFSLDDMEQMARYLADQSSKIFTESVGGPDQIAVLAKGGIVKIEQPPFPDPPRPLSFVLMVGLRIENAIPFQALGDQHILWIRSAFVGIRNPRLRLDNNFYYGCEVMGCFVECDGGLTDFGRTNSVYDSLLLPHVSTASGGANQDIRKNFKWLTDPTSVHT